MNGKALAVVLLVAVGVILLVRERQPEALAQNPPRGEPLGKWEYKVVFLTPHSPEILAKIRKAGPPASSTTGGRSNIVTTPPLPVEWGVAAADAYTRQYNTLAAEGWDYVGPLQEFQPDKQVLGTLVLFRRPVTPRNAPQPRGDGAAERTEQNPSPMVETTRAHPRLPREAPPGRREKLSLGTLYVPEALKPGAKLPLFVHFHGGTWLPEVAAEQARSAVLTVQLGAGSAAYGKPFADPEMFTRLLQEGETRLGCRFEPVGLTAWSAGYGAVRAILREPRHYERVRFVVLLDGLHAGYVDGKPGPQRSRLVTDDLAVFVQFARDAVAGKKQFLVVHSEIFPGTFASTTETADYLLEQLGLKRQAVVRWGPLQTQQLSEVCQGQLRVAGYAGNSAPDHVDLLHALPEFLKGVKRDDAP